MEIKQLNLGQQVHPIKNPKGNEKESWNEQKKKMETEDTQTYGIQQRQFYEESW